MNRVFVSYLKRKELLPNVIIIFLVTFFTCDIQAQVMEPDSIDISKTWQDKNGNNELSIRVYAACNPDKGPLDGHKTMIKASLKNSKYKIELKYDEKDYQMCMIFFDPADIVLKSIDGSEAVFIPFFYCGNADTQVKVSYIIFHNKKKYLKHIYFYCSWDGDCRLEDNLNKRLQGMPDYLKGEFMNQLSRYKNVSDLHAFF